MNPKLILFIILMVVLLFFIGLNLDNRTDVSLGFYTFEQVPVFFPILFSFIIGILFALPFTLFKKSRNKDKGQKNDAKQKAQTIDKNIPPQPDKDV